MKVIKGKNDGTFTEYLFDSRRVRRLPKILKCPSTQPNRRVNECVLCNEELN